MQLCANSELKQKKQKKKCKDRRCTAANGAENSGLINLLYLVIRDLKVSNLLMTDKGCVKIGESVR